MKKNKTSPLFSLADSFEYRPSCLNAFEELGAAAMGDYHIAVFFRNVVSSVLNVAHTNPVRPTKFCTIYNIQNSRGSLYGILFVVKDDCFQIKNSVLTVGPSGNESGSFAVYPFSDDKRSLAVFVDNKDNMVVNLSNAAFSDLVVYDE